MEDLPTDVLLEINQYLNDELKSLNRTIYNKVNEPLLYKLSKLDENTRYLLSGQTFVEEYRHYLSTKTYNRLTPKYRRGLSLLRSIVNSDTYYDLGDLIPIVDEAYKIMDLSPNLRRMLNLDAIFCYLGFNYGDDHRIHRSKRLLLSMLGKDVNAEYVTYLHDKFVLSVVRTDFDEYKELSFYDVDGSYVINVEEDYRILFDVYRYQHEANVRRLIEYHQIDDIPSIVGERWSYMYSGYYGDVTQAKTLVKGKYAQLLLDYALIGNQPDIVRMCVREGLNVSRYFDLCPSLVLELKPPNWEFYAIETGDLDVIAKTLESPNSLAINKAFGHIDVVEATSKQQ